MSAQGLSSGLGEQVVLGVVGGGAGLSWGWRGPVGWFLGVVGAGSGDGGRDHPESVGSEVGAERSAEGRRLGAWLGEARIGGRARGEAASFLRAGGPGRRPGAHLRPPRWAGVWPVTIGVPLPVSGAGSRRRPAGRAGGRAISTCTRTRGGARSAWRPPQGCCTRDVVGLCHGGHHAAPAPGVRGDRHGGPQAPAHDRGRRSTPPRTRGTPARLRPARRPPGGPRSSPSGRAGPGRAGRAPGRKPAGATLKEREGLSDGPPPQEARPSGTPPPFRPSPEQARNTRSETAPPRPEAQDTRRGRPGASTRTTEQQDKQPETPPSELSETHPAAQYGLRYFSLGGHLLAG